MTAKRFQTLYFELGGITKHLMTGPKGNSEFCFPSSLNVPLGFASGNIEVSGKQNSLFPLGPVIKCLIFHAKNKLTSFDFLVGNNSELLFSFSVESMLSVRS